ncbi:sensor histidine kinase [Acetobacter persici]|uniref:sensor histidine kinase n=1 Tax=Acetobacter persici TaxID=1076596 RepID=UPI001BA5841E|nr:ATP-binding protein [Acetobacter persici]MBS1014410.1 sensor histidine kinase [Acetobacter persici]
MGFKLHTASATLLRLLGLVAVCLLLTPVWQRGLYAMASLLVCVGAGCIVSLVATQVDLARRMQRSEPSVVTPTDREKLRNRALLDHAPVPLLYRSVDGTLHAANRAARRLFKTEDRLINPPGELLAALHDKRVSSEGRMIRLHSSAESRLRMYALSVGQGAGVGGIVEYLALTDVEAGLQAAEAQALRDLLQILSHEIMNSLTPIVSLSVTAEELFTDADKTASFPFIREALITLRRRAEGLDKFIRGYRELARLPPPDLAPVALEVLLRETQTLFQARWGAGVPLDVCLPSTRVLIRVDKAQIEQALLNLLNNAAEACAGQPSPLVQLVAEVTDGAAAILVRDNGTGLDPSLHEEIFYPFVSFKENGNGVGLSLARQIVLGHGGSLGVEAPEPESLWSTTFRIRL